MKKILIIAMLLISGCASTCKETVRTEVIDSVYLTSSNVPVINKSQRVHCVEVK